jgi:hypothetical protein
MDEYGHPVWQQCAGTILVQRKPKRGNFGLSKEKRKMIFFCFQSLVMEPILPSLNLHVRRFVLPVFGLYVSRSAESFLQRWSDRRIGPMVAVASIET